MLSRLLFILLFAFTAAAADGDLAPVTSLKVDLDKVVEYRTVSPVDGITVAIQKQDLHPVIRT